MLTDEQTRARANGFTTLLHEYNQRGVFWCDKCESLYGGPRPRHIEPLCGWNLRMCPTCGTPVDAEQLAVALPRASV